MCKPSPPRLPALPDHHHLPLLLLLLLLFLHHHHSLCPLRVGIHKPAWRARSIVCTSGKSATPGWTCPSRLPPPCPAPRTGASPPSAWRPRAGSSRRTRPTSPSTMYASCQPALTPDQLPPAAKCRARPRLAPPQSPALLRPVPRPMASRPHPWSRRATPCPTAASPPRRP